MVKWSLRMYHKFEGSYTNSGKIRPPENIVSLQLSQKKYTGPKKMQKTKWCQNLCS